MRGSTRSDGDRGRPGERLRALASRVCSARALERLIDPAIADLQSEHAQATVPGAAGADAGSAWRGRSRSGK
jgi:hypothetical protein